MSSFIGTTEFLKHMDDWLLYNLQKDADFLHRNKNKIPQIFRSHSKKLYRGMVVDADFISKVQERGITFDKHTSWSLDKKVAIKFTNDPKYRLAKRNTDEIPILIEKTVPQQYIILNIFGFVMFMGIEQLEMLGVDSINLDSAVKEQEILMSKGIRITRKDISTI